MMSSNKEAKMAVESVDVLSNAFEAAMARIETMKPSLGSTLVDNFPAQEWAAWDASQENCVVADHAADEGDCFDAADDEVAPKAA